MARFNPCFFFPAISSVTTREREKERITLDDVFQTYCLTSAKTLFYHCCPFLSIFVHWEEDRRVLCLLCIMLSREYNIIVHVDNVCVFMYVAILAQILKHTLIIILFFSLIFRSIAIIDLIVYINVEYNTILYKCIILHKWLFIVQMHIKEWYYKWNIYSLDLFHYFFWYSSNFWTGMNV